MHVTELDLSPATFVCLRAAQITDVGQLVTYSADDLIRFGFGATELYDVVSQLNMHGTSLPSSTGSKIHVPDERARAMFLLRVVDGLTLMEVGTRFDRSQEIVRRIMARHFGLRGSPPTVKARKWAETERHRAGPTV